MATDYDAPRKNDDDTESIEAIKETSVASPRVADVDMDEGDGGVGFAVPDVVNEDLEVVVIPEQDDEFTCSECFIVKHHSQLASGKGATAKCHECAN